MTIETRNALNARERELIASLDAVLASGDREALEALVTEVVAIWEERGWGPDVTKRFRR